MVLNSAVLRQKKKKPRHLQLRDEMRLNMIFICNYATIWSRIWPAIWKELSIVLDDKRRNALPLK